MAPLNTHEEYPAGAGVLLVESSFRPPTGSASAVPRERLIEILADPDAPPVTALFAPPGYGKTTLLAAWAARESRPVAWLTLTAFDNDPVRLLTYVIGAYAHVGPIGRELTGPPPGADRLLAGPLPRLLAQLSTWEQPAILVLDDVHRIEDQASLDLLSMLLDHLPPGFRVALAGRSPTRLPFARLRASRMLREIGIRQLALDAGETAELARLAGLPLDAQAARDLTMRTEGWATGVYLALLASADSGERLAVGRVSGSDHYIADYLDAEVGRGLSADDLVFLTRTSILDTVTPGAALAVTGLDHAGERLERLARTNLLISRVDGVPDAYRYHTTLREYLRAQLDTREPDAACALHLKAAAHFASLGSHEGAIVNAFAGHDTGAAARYLIAGIVPMYQKGQAHQLMRWVEQIPVRELEGTPMLALLGSWLHLLEGRAERAEVLAEMADRSEGLDLIVPVRTFVMSRLMLHSVLGREGFAASVAGAAEAMEDEATPDQWRGAAGVLLGFAGLAGPEIDVEAVDAVLTKTLLYAPAASAEARMSALALQALVRMHAGDLDRAATLATQARAVLATTNDLDAVTSLVVYAADARIRALRGDVPGARETLVRAQLVRPLASHASPWQSVPPLLELARTYLALSDPGGAQTVIRQAEDIVRKRPGLGGYVDQLIALRRQLQDASSVLAGSSTLTTAELRVLPLLPTYLSFEEIGERLNVSRNTVKTHAMSIYGKLWASSRGEAVERAVELGLLEPYPVLERHSGDRGRD